MYTIIALVTDYEKENIQEPQNSWGQTESLGFFAGFICFVFKL